MSPLDKLRFLMLIVMMLMVMSFCDALSVVKDVSSSVCIVQREDFMFMDDYLAEGLLRLCVHLVKVSLPAFHRDNVLSDSPASVSCMIA